MLELKVVVLADAANVREGLLSVIGGGLSVLRYPNYPVPLQADLGLMFQISDLVEGESHAIKIECVRVDAQQRSVPDDPMFEVEARLVAGPSPELAARHRNAPLAVPLHNVGVPTPGEYRVSVSVDGEVLGSVSFEALLVPDAPNPFAPPQDEAFNRDAEAEQAQLDPES